MSLTDEQINELRTVAIEVIYDDAVQDRDYLLGILNAYLDGMTPLDMAQCISDDMEFVANMVGFDPKTGKQVSPD